MAVSNGQICDLKLVTHLGFCVLVVNVQFYIDLPCFVFIYCGIDMILLGPFRNLITLLNKIICLCVAVYLCACFILIFEYKSSQFLEEYTVIP